VPHHFDADDGASQALVRAFRSDAALNAAIVCARFPECEGSILSVLLAGGGYVARLIRNQGAPIPVDVFRPEVIGAIDASPDAIRESLDRLRAGNVIRSRDGGWTINPNWRTWRNARGKPLVKKRYELCIGFIGSPEPEDDR
jgi:hypothetical protein